MFYRSFTTEFNINFFKPKKDQCDLCILYENNSEEEKKQLEDTYTSHINEKKSLENR